MLYESKIWAEAHPWGASALKHPWAAPREVWASVSVVRQPKTPAGTRGNVHLLTKFSWKEDVWGCRDPGDTFLNFLRKKVCIHYPGTWAYMDTDRREWTNTHTFVNVYVYVKLINSHLQDNRIHGTFKLHRKSFVSMALLIIHRNWTHFFSYNPK